MWKWDAAPWNNGQIIATTGTNGTSSSTWWTPATPNPCYAYNPATDVWTAKINLATPVLGAYVGSTKLGNTWKLLVASGYTGAAAVTNTQIFTEIVTGISNPINGETPSKYAISQNYPNPFNPVTKINYALPKSGLVTMKVYDILGKEVATLVNEVKNAGYYSVEFNASTLASGMYFYRIETNGFNEVRKMMLIK
ncbi:MAG: T9SS type A sorting domain-containing protein [Bacteroidetes bacterium]|nr:T9SS type A sorting domain-containing protein [Bacteroidota bacterium]